MVVWDKTHCTACIFTAALYNCVTSCARTQKKETHGSEHSFTLVIFFMSSNSVHHKKLEQCSTRKHASARPRWSTFGKRINPICIDQQSLLETSKIPWKSVAMYIWRQS